MPLKRLSFCDSSRLLTPYGCREFIFVSEADPGVRTVTLSRPARNSLQGYTQYLALAMVGTALIAMVTAVATSTDAVNDAIMAKGVSRSANQWRSIAAHP